MNHDNTPEEQALNTIMAMTDTTHVGYLAIQCLANRLEAIEASGARISKFTPPTPAEAEAYAKSIGFSMDGNAFCDFYEARGWLLGKTKMKSWKACIRTWKGRRDVENQPKPAGRLPDNLRSDHGL